MGPIDNNNISYFVKAVTFSNKGYCLFIVICNQANLQRFGSVVVTEPVKVTTVEELLKNIKKIKIVTKRK